jgi:xanthosine utilization system XapX-like protein
VTCEFGDENVDALEAVAFQKDIPLPVPGTLALLGIVVLSLGRRIRRMV